MPRIVVLFNLKPDVDSTLYETWAKNTDAPTVNSLSSVTGFTIHRATGLLGSETPSPYAYVEILDVTSIDGLFADISTEAMQQVADQFQAFADNPQFIVTEDLT